MLLIIILNIAFSLLAVVGIVGIHLWAIWTSNPPEALFSAQLRRAWSRRARPAKRSAERLVARRLPPLSQ